MAVIGPLTVQPSAEGGGVGRALMEAALAEAQRRQQDQVRLVQSPSHIRSFVLYTKTGFSLREPLFLTQGQPLLKEKTKRYDNVRAVQSDADIAKCNELCKSVHGFSREMELRQAKEQTNAILIERNGALTEYAAGIGLFGHAVAKSNDDLKALIASVPAIVGPGFFVPARNYELAKWLFENGFRIAWPANLMTLGPYQEPASPFLPSTAY